MEAQLPQQAQCPLNGVRVPYRFAHAAGSDAGRRLQQLPAAEHAQRPPLAVQIAAHRPQRVVSARYQLLEHRLERLSQPVGGHQRRGVRGLDQRLPVARLEPAAQRRLHHRRVGDGGRRLLCLLDGRRVERLRKPHPGPLGRCVLEALRLHPIDQLARAERQPQARRRRVVHRHQVVVVGRKGHRLAPQRIAHLGEVLCEPLPLARRRPDDAQRQPRAHPQAVAPVVERHHRRPDPRQASDRRQPVHIRALEHQRRRLLGAVGKPCQPLPQRRGKSHPQAPCQPMLRPSRCSSLLFGSA